MKDLPQSTAVTEACASFDDSRIHHCRLEIAGTTPDHTVVTGTVLDESTLGQVAEVLADLRPDIMWDITSVQVLRQDEPEMLAVHTNMTGFMREPSWLSEQQSQVLNGMLAEVLNDRERWTFVRLADGYLGWLYRPYLGPPQVEFEPTHMFCSPLTLLHKTAAVESPLVTRAFAGTLVKVRSSYDDWAEVELVGGPAGFVPATDLREVTSVPQGDDQRHQLIADAMRYIGVPYSWGGTTVLGIDCSGFAQLMHRLRGVVIPRDADQQFVAGEPVEPPFQVGDLMFFGGPGDHRAISHVGISMGPAYDPQGWQMIHSSRSRNGVYIDDIQAVESLRERFRGARRFL